MRLLSWNVNGLRAVRSKGFLEWLYQEQPTILCLQETKAKKNQLDSELLAPTGYHAYWASAERKGYSGTAIYSKSRPRQVDQLGISEFDVEGRTLVAYYDDFVLINCYFPNSQPQGVRLDYKLAFNQAIHSFSDNLSRQNTAVIIAGDYNVAHLPIDLARPNENEGSPGYLPEERQWMSSFLNSGYIDTFRHFCPAPQQYSWWSYRSAARSRNIGWRIDYFCVNKILLQRLANARIHSAVTGSDHCPVELELNSLTEEATWPS